MKLLILICAAIMLLQLGTLGLGVWRGEGDETKKEGESGTYKPDFPGNRLLRRVSAFFRPEIDLGWTDDRHAFDSGGGDGEVDFSGGDPDGPVTVGFELLSGPEVVITSNCQPGSPLEKKPELTLCLPDGESCPSEGDIIVCGETGRIEFTANGGRVVVRKQ